MNGLAGLSIVAIFVLGVASVSAINGIRSNEAKIEQVKKTKEVITTVKQSDVASKAVGNYISNAGYIPNVNPNSLNLKSLDLSDKSLITKFSNAMEYAVVKENIRKPTCGDLASTGMISLDECKYIANKKGLYVNVKNGTLEIAALPTQTQTAENGSNEIETFVHITQVMNGTQDVSSTSQNTDDSQTAESDYFKDVKTPSIKIPLTASVITQTINTNDAAADKVITKEIVTKSIENLNDKKNVESVIVNLTNIRKKDGEVSDRKTDVSTTKTEDQNVIKELTPVSLKDKETLTPAENFKTSFTMSKDNEKTDDKNDVTERRP